MSSIAHNYRYDTNCGIRFDDFNYEKGFSYMEAYGHSKLANILHAKELAKRLENTCISVYSLHPGYILTDLMRDIEKNRLTKLSAIIVKSLIQFSFKTPFHGAQTTLYCCLENKIEHESGFYYSDCARVNPTVAAQNEEAAKQLWELSERLVGLKPN